MSKEQEITDIFLSLKEKRKEVLDKYLEDLRNYNGNDTKNTGECVNAAMLLHDIDRHLNNLIQEMAALEKNRFLENSNQTFVNGIGGLNV